MLSIGFLSAKKGGGCTTAAINTARYIAGGGYSVTIVEPKNVLSPVFAQLDEMDRFRDGIIIFPEWEGEAIDTDVAIYDLGYVPNLSKITYCNKIFLCSDTDDKDINTLAEYIYDNGTDYTVLLKSCSKEKLAAFKKIKSSKVFTIPESPTRCPQDLAELLDMTLQMAGLIPPSENLETDKWEGLEIVEESTDASAFDSFMSRTTRLAKTLGDTLKSGKKGKAGTDSTEQESEEDTENIKDQDVLADNPKKSSWFKRKKDKPAKSVESESVDDTGEQKTLDDEGPSKAELKQQQKELEEQKKEEARLAKLQKAEEARQLKEQKAEEARIKAEEARILKEQKEEEARILKAQKEEEAKAKAEEARIKAEEARQLREQKEEEARLAKLKREEEAEALKLQKAEEARIAREEKAAKLEELRKEKELKAEEARIEREIKAEEARIAREAALKEKEAQLKAKEEERRLKELERELAKDDEEPDDEEDDTPSPKKKEKKGKDPKVEYFGHATIFVTSLRNGAGNSYAAGSIASAFTSKGNSVCLCHKDGTNYPEDKKIFEYTNLNDISGAYKNRIVVIDPGPFGVMEKNMLQEMQRADIKILVSAEDERDIERLAQFIHKLGDGIAKEWLYVFNLPRDRRRQSEIEELMQDYHIMFLPMHDYNKIPGNVATKWLKEIKAHQKML